MNDYEQIGAVLAERLAQITVALGAETDAGARVYRGRRNISDELMPCAVLIEGNTPSGDRRGGRSIEYTLAADYALHAYVPCDPDNPNVAAHAALRDLKRKVFVDSTFGGTVKDVAFVSTDIAPRADGAAFVLATLSITVTFYERMAAP